MYTYVMVKVFRDFRFLVKLCHRMITCTVTLWYHSAGMFVDKNVPFEELPVRYVYVCTLYVCACVCCMCVANNVLVRAIITVLCFRLVAFGRCYRAEAGKCQYV